MLSLFSLCAGSLGEEIIQAVTNVWHSTGIYSLINGSANWQNIVMVIISFVLVYLAIVKKFEPLLLLPIAFGMFIVNVPGAYRILFGTKGFIVTNSITNVEVARGTLDEILAMFGQTGSIEQLQKTFTEVGGQLVGSNVTYNARTLVISTEQVVRDFGLFYYIYKGVDWVIFPPLIFLGIGAMTDFGPLIANPKSMLIGAAAQLGIFITYLIMINIINGLFLYFH